MQNELFISGRGVKEDDTGRACSMNVREEECI
jgi:hypothetical protein